MKDSSNPSTGINTAHSPEQPQRGGYALRQQFCLCVFSLAFVVAFVLVASSLTLFVPSTHAQYPTPPINCSPTATPTASPTQPPVSPSPGCSVNPPLNGINNPPLVAVPGPTPPDGTTLQWRIFSPDGSGPWPAILLVHGGGFTDGDPVGGAIETIAKQLKDNGYYVAIPTYRLAPWGLITNQVCHDATHDPDGLSGRPPEQSDDVKAEVIALRADTHCNGKVGVVGGSAGGTWAVWTALDTNSSGNAYPFWNASKRADCAVGISGAYEFDDRTPTGYAPDPLPTFIRKVENYTNTTDPDDQHGFSPVALVTTPSEQFPFKPLFLINSIHDFMPYHQIVDMICELEEHNVPSSDYQVLTISGNDHSFAIWFDWNGIEPVGDGPNHPVSYDVILFLDANLK